MSFQENVKELQNMVFSGQLLEAFDKYYHADVVMQENAETPFEGKSANREREVEFVGKIEAFHGGGVTNIAYDEANQIAMIESWMDVTFKGGPRFKLEQVAVQKWQDGQVISERFYHT